MACLEVPYSDMIMRWHSVACSDMAWHGVQWHGCCMLWLGCWFGHGHLEGCQPWWLSVVIMVADGPMAAGSMAVGSEAKAVAGFIY